jgi:hypothetical protein
MAIPLSDAPESRRSPRLPTEIGRLVTLSVRSFAGAPSRRKAGGAPLWGYIGFGSLPCQQRKPQISPQLRAVDGLPQPFCHGASTGVGAPHSRHIPPALFAPGNGQWVQFESRLLRLSARTRRRGRGFGLLLCCLPATGTIGWDCRASSSAVELRGQGAWIKANGAIQIVYGQPQRRSISARIRHCWSMARRPA